MFDFSKAAEKIILLAYDKEGCMIRVDTEFYKTMKKAHNNKTSEQHGKKNIQWKNVKHSRWCNKKAGIK